jgi:hypothetical protein
MPRTCQLYWTISKWYQQTVVKLYTVVKSSNGWDAVLQTIFPWTNQTQPNVWDPTSHPTVSRPPNLTSSVWRGKIIPSVWEVGCQVGLGIHENSPKTEGGLGASRQPGRVNSFSFTDRVDECGYTFWDDLDWVLYVGKCQKLAVE